MKSESPKRRMPAVSPATRGEGIERKYNRLESTFSIGPMDTRNPGWMDDSSGDPEPVLAE